MPDDVACMAGRDTKGALVELHERYGHVYMVSLDLPAAAHLKKESTLTCMACAKGKSTKLAITTLPRQSKRFRSGVLTVLGCYISFEQPCYPPQARRY